MSIVILHVLCEGQTEEQFARKVLKNHLQAFNIAVKQTVLLTNPKKGAQGGILNYSNQVKRDLKLLFKQNSSSSNNYEKHFYTTMFDLYALPKDFPGYEKAENCQDCYNKVKILEEAFRDDIQNPQFIPYIQLHEFEALVFCGLDYFTDEDPTTAEAVEEMKKVLVQYDDNPEKINNGCQTAPSKRIICEMEKINRSYNKPKYGSEITQYVGISSLMSKCSHFREWIERLEKLQSLI
ncbi:Uncharacterised protein [Porphyromonas cangingivalis]|uniref:DUF4276 family protein n=1 Tax=Porphyromonas cangingivalis TaxID=36874 RepID=UPI000D842AE8|nr:DUF4276 family protein [Porphyromonas cangingivalis]SPY35059.1 Uncharacterised protein [Porphyromonas cangingivalis]